MTTEQTARYLIWAAADQRTRGFLMGGTAGRTTLNGEGLQHEDGHSHLISATVPNCVSYDPTYAYELAVSSTKSMTGHECWMAGASEVVYSLLMMQNSFIAPNINFENPDEDSAKLNIVKNTIDKDIFVFLSNSFGFGGTNSSIIIKGMK